MANVDELDQQKAALLEYALRFFNGVRSREDVYARFGLCYNQLQAELTKMAESGVLTPGAAEAWSWFSIAMPAIAKVAFLQEPKWGTRELEAQLQETFRKSLQRTRTVTIERPGSAIEPAPADVDVDLPETAGAAIPPKTH